MKSTFAPTIADHAALATRETSVIPETSVSCVTNANRVTSVMIVAIATTGTAIARIVATVRATSNADTAGISTVVQTSPIGLSKSRCRTSHRPRLRTTTPKCPSPETPSMARKRIFAARRIAPVVGDGVGVAVEVVDRPPRSEPPPGFPSPAKIHSSHASSWSRSMCRSPRNSMKIRLAMRSNPVPVRTNARVTLATRKVSRAAASVAGVGVAGEGAVETATRTPIRTPRAEEILSAKAIRRAKVVARVKAIRCET